MKHRHGSHTKYHYRVLVGEVGLRVRELVRQTCEHFEIEILRGVVSNDHVHLLVSAAPPSLSPSDIMKRVKGRSSTRFFQEFPRLKKRYWGQHFWAMGYFCVTAGELTKQMIEEYLQHHFEKNFDDNFEVE